MFKKIVLLSCLLGAPAYPAPRIQFVIHGGAGPINAQSVMNEEAAFDEVLKRAVVVGYDALKSGRSSLDAIEIALKLLEDSPLFNAGVGAVLTEKGEVELDASIMDGKTLEAGAVAGVRHVKNPISLARAVLEKSGHVMLVGDGAEEFAKREKFELVSNAYFITKKRREQYEKRVKEEKNKQRQGKLFEAKREWKLGTVGAIARDNKGVLAAGTSTGGTMFKRFGRVGDSPIIGAGTYANTHCAVSSTGMGEIFIRLSVARDICAEIEYNNSTAQDAADRVIRKVTALNGEGGVIVLDAKDRMGISFNTEGMFRAYIDEKGIPIVEMFAKKAEGAR